VYRGLLLDLYGTLVHDDDTPVCAEVAANAGVATAVVAAEWAARLDALASPAHGAGFRTLADLNRAALAGTAAHVGATLDVDALIRPQEHPLYPDARPFLAQVGLPVCLVSDADRAEVEAVLARHGIVVDAVVTSEDVRAYKPRPEPFRAALAALGLSAAEVVHVGNSPVYDVAGAAALGIATGYVDRGGRGRPAGTTATYSARSLTGLLPYLRS
jgi:2-haloacid dehalogenase/putative hydrolase of the HAD superfamily